MSETGRVVAAHYDAISRKDLDAVLRTVSEDVVWEFPASKAIPFAGRHDGRGAVRDFFAKIGGSVDVKEIVVERTVVDGDTAIVFGRERFEVRDTGVEWTTDWVQVHTVINGKIARCREYADTAAIADAYRGLQA